MRSVLVTNFLTGGDYGSDNFSKHKTRKDRIKSFLGSVVISMRNMLYQLIGGTFILGMVVGGMLLQSGADYMKERAATDARIEMLFQLSLAGLKDIAVTPKKHVDL